MSRLSASTGILLALALGTSDPAAAQADTDALIRSALSAAPAAIADAATVIDGKGKVLRQGSNGWVCMPDDPAIPNNSPMCLDQPWLRFVEAMMARRAPAIDAIGIGYMLQGDMPVSNLDPFATGPTAGNQWLADGTPHIMMILPDSSLLAGYSSDPHRGGPWVMWKGTPYAHLMIPTVPRK